MGGMNDENYLDYIPQILQYDSNNIKTSQSKAKIRLKMLKQAQKAQNRKQRKSSKVSNLGITFDYLSKNRTKNDDQGTYNSQDIDSMDLPAKEFGFDRMDSFEREKKSTEEKIAQGFRERMKFKNGEDFTSFLPLPDAFHEFVHIKTVEKSLRKEIERDHHHQMMRLGSPQKQKRPILE